MKPSRIREVLVKVLKTRWPAFIWGPPGVGKSSVVHQVAKDLSLSVLDVRASQLDPTDLRGIPAVINGQAVWCPPAFLPSPDAPAGILFLDEINAAPPLVQASLYQLVLDRRIGDYILPPNWHIIAAGNRSEDRAVVFRLSSALANRFVHLNFETSFDDWRQWALDVGIHPMVVGFLALRRELLHSPSTTEHAFPTPRSWEMVSDTLQHFKSPDDCHDVLVGTIGEGAATEFSAFARTALHERDFLKIISSPEDAELPSGIGNQYALVSWLIARRKEPTVLSAAARLLDRLPPELSVILVRDMVRADALFVTEPGYIQFMKAHPGLLNG